MPNLARKVAKIFGINSPNDRMAVVGSLRQGAPQYSKDPNTLQSLSNFEDGWPGIAIGNSSPPLEDMNSVQYIASYQIAYLMQKGVAEWNSETTYYVGSLINFAGSLLVSLQNDNLNHPVTDSAWWAVYGARVKNVATNYQVLPSDDTIRGNGAPGVGGLIITTLPPLSTVPMGHRVIIKNISDPVSSGVVKMKVSDPATELIDLYTELDLHSSPTQQDAITVQKGGPLQWDII